MTQTWDSNADSKYLKYVPFTDKHYNLFLLSYLTQNAIFRARHCQVMKVGLTHTEFLLLLVVDAMGGSAGPAEISRWLMRKPPTISGLLNRMERNGLVKRRSDARNKKLRKVVVTRKGKKAFGLARENDVMHTIIGSISEEEFGQLWSLLERLKDIALSLTENEKLMDAVPSPS